MTKVNLFGLEFGDEDDSDTQSFKRETQVRSKKEYEIPREILLQKLGFAEKNIVFIKYDHIKKVLQLEESLYERR